MLSVLEIAECLTFIHVRERVGVGVGVVVVVAGVQLVSLNSRAFQLGFV